MRLMLRYRLRALLSSWQREASYRAAKKAAWLAAERQARRAVLCAAFGGWQAVAAQKGAARRATERAQQRLGRLRARQALLEWRGELETAAERRAAKQTAQQYWQCNMQRHVLRGWRYASWSGRTALAAGSKQQRRVAAAAFAGWRQHAELATARQGLLQELSAARTARLLACAFSAWLAAVEGLRSRQQADAFDRSAREADSCRCYRPCCWSAVPG